VGGYRGKRLNQGVNRTKSGSANKARESIQIRLKQMTTPDSDNRIAGSIDNGVHRGNPRIRLMVKRGGKERVNRKGYRSESIGYVDDQEKEEILLGRFCYRTCDGRGKGRAIIRQC